MADHKPGTRSGSGRKPPPKVLPAEQKTGFHPGKTGLCEAQLWEFTGPARFLEPDQEIPIERVAAGSLDQALQYMRRKHHDFIICKAEAIGIIALLSGSPLD